MAYRSITVDGQNYKWLVGRKNIEIRSEPDKNKKVWKRVLERPAPQKRWGLITPNMETAGLNIAMFDKELSCEMALEEAKKTSPCKDQVEMVTLPAKKVSITPVWIKNAIRTELRK